MVKKKIFVAFLIFGLAPILPPAKILAAKQRPPRLSGGTTSSTVARSSATRGVQSSVRFRSDRRGLLINFSDFSNIISVTYTLTYTSNGVSQGAMGTALPGTAGQQRELLFGTCSSGVCRWHTDIRDVRLLIDSKLKSGVIVRKPYRIKL